MTTATRTNWRSTLGKLPRTWTRIFKGTWADARAFAQRANNARLRYGYPVDITQADGEVFARKVTR